MEYWSKENRGNILLENMSNSRERFHPLVTRILYSCFIFMPICSWTYRLAVLQRWLQIYKMSLRARFCQLLQLHVPRNPDSDSPIQQHCCTALRSINSFGSGQYYLCSKFRVLLFIKSHLDNKVSSPILRFCSNIMYRYNAEKSKETFLVILQHICI